MRKKVISHHLAFYSSMDSALIRDVNLRTQPEDKNLSLIELLRGSEIVICQRLDHKIHEDRRIECPDIIR